jgi:hypothetical protein
MTIRTLEAFSNIVGVIITIALAMFLPAAALLEGFGLLPTA